MSETSFGLLTLTSNHNHHHTDIMLRYLQEQMKLDCLIYYTLSVISRPFQAHWQPLYHPLAISVKYLRQERQTIVYPSRSRYRLSIKC